MGRTTMDDRGGPATATAMATAKAKAKAKATSRRRRPLRLALLHGAALLAAGCATTAPPAPPAEALVQVPTAWSEPLALDAVAVAPDWWRAFDAQPLVELVAAVLEASPDLAVANERVLQAEQLLRIAGASLFPSVGASIASSDRDGAGGGSASAGLSAAYELDLWGGIASQRRAAQASAAARRFDVSAARLSLSAAAADGYFQLLALRSRLAIARENAALAERVLALVETRARLGAASALDVARQRAAVNAQRATLPALEQQERQVLAALAVLAGRTPGAFDVAGGDVTALAVPLPDAGVPVQLLARRPDLASAEAQIAAAGASVAAARAALLPSIRLTASASLVGGGVAALLGSPASVASIAASVLQPIFEGGRLRAQVALSESQQRELVQGYRAAVLGAFADVENALVAADRSTRQEDLQRSVRDDARRALGLAEARYRAGSDDLLALLDAQRTLFQAEDQLAQLRAARLRSAAALYKAVGGGWRAEAGAA